MLRIDNKDNTSSIGNAREWLDFQIFGQENELSEHILMLNKRHFVLKYAKKIRS